MILSAQSIRQRRIFSPFAERTRHNGLTFGLSPAGYDVRVREGLFLHPGQFCLASTLEHFDMPADVLGVVHDKSTWARLGLAVQNTVIEPGWRGYLTLEITNHGADQVSVLPGSPIAQIIMHMLDEPTELIYSGKYQDQVSRPTPAIFDLSADAQVSP